MSVGKPNWSGTTKQCPDTAVASRDGLAARGHGPGTARLSPRAHHLRNQAATDPADRRRDAGELSSSASPVPDPSSASRPRTAAARRDRRPQGRKSAGRGPFCFLARSPSRIGSNGSAQHRPSLLDAGRSAVYDRRCDLPRCGAWSPRESEVGGAKRSDRRFGPQLRLGTTIDRGRAVAGPVASVRDMALHEDTGIRFGWRTR